MRRGGGPLTVLALAQAAATYEFTVAFVALPAIVGSLGVPPSLVPWVPGAYAVVFGGALLAAGRVTDRHGARRVLRVALLGLAATTAVVALAGSPAVVLAGRAGQGLAAAALQPAVLGAMGRVATGGVRARVWSVWSAVGAGGLALGVAGGGALVALDWRLAVGVVVPVCVAAAWYVRVLPPDVAASSSVRVPVVAAGVTTTAGAAAAATITLGVALGWTAPATVAAGTVGVLAGAGVVVGERSATPLLGRALRRRRDVRLGAALAAVYMAGPGALYFLLTAGVSGVASQTFSVSDVASLTSPAAVGLRLVPLTVGVVVGSASAGWGIRRVGEERAAALGFGVAALGTWGLVSGPAVVSSAVAGLGSGLAFAAVFALAGRDVPADLRGAAGGVVAAAQYLASSVALAVYGVLAGPLGPPGVIALAGIAALGGAAGAWAGSRGDQGVTARPIGDPDDPQ